MTPSGADLYGLQSFACIIGAGAVAHAHRNSRVAAAAVVAELATAVASPGIHVSVAAQGQRMRAAGTDLHVGEIRRRACRLPDHDRRSPIGGRPVAKLARTVVSPGVGVPVAAHRQGKIISVADLVESDVLIIGRRGDGGLLLAELAAVVGADAPRVVGLFGRPVGGEGEALVDGLAEVVGDAAGEPSVEPVALACGVGGGPLDSAVRCGEMLICGFGASAARIESNCVGRALLIFSDQRLVDRVVEASGEGLAVLAAGDEDGGLSGLAGGDLRPPGLVVLAERQCLPVHAG